MSKKKVKKTEAVDAEYEELDENGEVKEIKEEKKKMSKRTIGMLFAGGGALLVAGFMFVKHKVFGGPDYYDYLPDSNENSEESTDEEGTTSEGETEE